VAVPEPIERRKVYELLAEQLRRQISSGALKPGDGVPTERALTQAYRVGRSSVREALRMLESQGLIEAVGNGSFVVAGEQQLMNHSLRLLLALDKVNLLELYEVRKILEAEAAVLAAVRRSNEDLVRMEQAINHMMAGLDTPDQFSQADLRFHLDIAAATRNRMIFHMMNGIRDPLQRSLASVARIPGSPARFLAQHRAIKEAITAGLPDAARAAMLDHLARVEEDVRSILVGPPGGSPMRMEQG